ncbi:Mobile element protein [Lutibaculum baratangense AMV1]|uniref:Mobile element protein n=1 Tax=Lutibaculum baratangense AMV1 TaxID=631454 RepID=V4RH54_9HYPH|nr:Mobile element protein [Lutibaculum baratangense AMV1]
MCSVLPDLPTAANAGHLSLAQLKVMSAIECRTAALGGHVEACEDCGHRRIAYRSRRDRPYRRLPGRSSSRGMDAR